MASLKDIDEVVLTKANELLTYVHLNAGRHTLKKRRLLCLAELPELLVDLFELITDEPIPGDLKPFRTPQDRCETLQSIIDSLQLYLNLPLSHINGKDLARLDRRQLCDVIQIFDDLIKQLFPVQTDRSVQTQLSHDVIKQNEIPTSQDPSYPYQPLTLEHLYVSTPGKSHVNPIAQLSRPVSVLESEITKNQPSVNKSTFTKVSGIKSSEKLLKSSRNASAAADSESIPRKPATIALRHKASDARSGSTRCISPIASQDSLPRKPLQLHLKRKPSAAGSALSRNVSSASSRQPVKVPDVPQKPVIIPLRRLSRKSVASPIEKIGHRQSKFTRRPSTKSFKSGPTVIKLSKPSVSASTSSKSLVGESERKPSVTSKPAVATQSARGPLSKPIGTTSKHRRPSVVSSKVRKHSFGSPVLECSFSPRTVSLASSIKLLQEFDFVIKRLSEIEQEMEKHLEALRCLQDEKVRLVYVMEHVKKVSNRPTQQFSL